MPSSTPVRGIDLAALLLPSIGLAQSPPPAAVAQPTPAPAPSAATQAAVDQRIKTLQSQLGITEPQMPLWSAFAQAMRDNAASTEALFAQRAGTVTTMSATDNMHSYAQIARAYADNTLQRGNIIGQRFGQRHEPDYPILSGPGLLSTTG
jgi:hypothetical protein